MTSLKHGNFDIANQAMSLRFQFWPCFLNFWERYQSQSVTMPTMVPKAPFSDGYKGLDEIVTEIVGRYMNLADSCDDHLLSHRRFYFVHSKFCFLILQKHDLKSFFKTTWLYINNQFAFISPCFTIFGCKNTANTASWLKPCCKHFVLVLRGKIARLGAEVIKLDATCILLET